MIIEDIHQSYYAVIPATIRYDTVLKPNAKLLYAEITSLTNMYGYCCATNAYFADLYGFTDETVSRLISQLEKQGHIAVEITPNGGGSERKIYVGNYVDPLDQKIKRVGDPLDQKIKRSKSSITNILNSRNNNIPPQVPLKGESVCKRVHKADKSPRKLPDWKPERWSGLWAYYPIQGKKNKQRALDVWDRLKPSDELINTIALALKKQKESDEWQRGIGIPHLATYLNGARWEDADELPSDDDAPETWADDPEVIP